MWGTMPRQRKELRSGDSSGDPILSYSLSLNIVVSEKCPSENERNQGSTCKGSDEWKRHSLHLWQDLYGCGGGGLVGKEISRVQPSRRGSGSTSMKVNNVGSPDVSNNWNKSAFIFTIGWKGYSQVYETLA